MTALFWLALAVPVLAGALAQRRVTAVFARYRRVPNRIGATGAELARALLDAHGLRQVRLELAPGFLGDQYDGAAHVLRLSEAVARERSVASLAIAAHEVSHAYQDAEGSRVYRIRRSVGEPLARAAPWSGLVFIGGFFLGVPVLMILAVAYVAGLVLFALATLPVELGASRRAVMLLHAAGFADDEESHEVRQVLTAAALTYFVGLLRQLGFFLVLVLLAEATRRATRGG
jgi:Zn-dependent membrane protease YugP